GCVSPALKEGSRCKFPLAELIKGNNFESIGTGMKLISGAEHTEHVKNAIFWEINAYPLPTQEEIHRMDDRPTHRKRVHPSELEAFESLSGVLGVLVERSDIG
ncbi:hypothetical protein Tco_0919010, partial [Tanacetum coccineum]